MRNIKNTIFSTFVLFFLICVSSANSGENCKQMYESECPTAKEQNEIQNNAQGLELNKPCEKCKVEDDEYCIYNQCYFDKQYRLLKQELQPNANQENCLDNIYMNFKQDLEILCERYTKEKDKLLDLISKDVKCIKEQKNTVHDIQTDIKEKYKDYLSDTNEILCKNQKKIFKSFKKDQNKKIKKIKKYGAVYKFPCS